MENTYDGCQTIAAAEPSYDTVRRCQVLESGLALTLVLRLRSQFSATLADFHHFGVQTAIFRALATLCHPYLGK